MAEIFNVVRGAVPDVGVLGDDAQRDALTASTDEDGRMWLLNRLRFTYRAVQAVAAPIEVEGLALGPHPLDDGAGLIERSESL